MLLASAENQRLLSELLAHRYEVVADVAAGIDLCIVDGLSLHRQWNRLLDARARQEPVLLPVLLLSDRRDVGLMTRAAWRVADDVLLRPVERAELAARVETMLRARRLSLRLQRVSELYEHEQRIARRLQEAALPHELPRIAGLAFDAFYRAGADDARIGGDWYDALRLPDGRVVLSIGDVSGSGLEAAVTMASLRQILRGVAQIHPDPAMMLDAADRTLQTEARERMATAFVGVLDPVTSLLTYASAGHPRPLLRDAAGAVCELTAGGLPLGMPDRSERGTELVTLPAGALLVLYTDGLTETTRDLVAGEARLHDVVRAGWADDEPHPAQRLHDAVVPGAARDDVAVFTVRCFADDAARYAVRRWSFQSGDAAGAHAVRHELTAALDEHGLGPEALVAAELAFAELIGNVVRYAPGRAEVALDRTGQQPVLHVLDRGRGFRHLPRLPDDLLSERGRGLYIVSALTEELTVSRRPDGGSHARAVLRPGAAPTALLDPFVAFGGLDTIAADT